MTRTKEKPKPPGYITNETRWQCPLCHAFVPKKANETAQLMSEWMSKKGEPPEWFHMLCPESRGVSVKCIDWLQQKLGKKFQCVSCLAFCPLKAPRPRKKKDGTWVPGWHCDKEAVISPWIHTHADGTQHHCRDMESDGRVAVLSGTGGRLATLLVSCTRLDGEIRSVDCHDAWHCQGQYSWCAECLWGEDRWGPADPDKACREIFSPTEVKVDEKATARLQKQAAAEKPKQPGYSYRSTRPRVRAGRSGATAAEHRKLQRKLWDA